VNPLNIPQWGKPEEPKDGRKVPSFLGVRNEAVRDDVEAEEIITIQVRGLKGTADGIYKLAYSPGTSLGKYLRRLQLRRAATYSAVYDTTNLEKGRCRMTYIPDKGAIILIGQAVFGPVSHLQRSSVDAQRAAFNMGGGSKVVEYKK